jgi:Rieske Fe-S protein
MNRRELLQSSFFLALPKSCCELPPLPANSISLQAAAVSIDLRLAPDLQQAGGAARLLDAERKLNLIVARTAQDEFHAWSGICTHGGAPLAYNHRHRSALCSSVGHSEFDARGQVIRGPAPKPIAFYKATLSGHRLTIELEAQA